MLPDYQLLDAARLGSFQMARGAVDRGANVHARDLDGHSTLYLACTNGHMQLAEFLVERGADVDATFGKRKQTLLHWAAKHGHHYLVQLLLKHNALLPLEI